VEALSFRQQPELRGAIVVVTGKSVKTRGKWECEDEEKVEVPCWYQILLP